METFKKIYTRISQAMSNVIFVLLLFALLMVVVSQIDAKKTGGQPELFGHTGFIVLSGSMEPDMAVNGITIVKRTDPETLEAGMIATYKVFDEDRRESVYVTHRVVKNNHDEKTINMIGNQMSNGANAILETINYSDVYYEYVYAANWIAPFVGFLMGGLTNIMVATAFFVGILIILHIIRSYIYDEQYEFHPFNKSKRQKAIEVAEQVEVPSEQVDTKEE